MPRTKFGPFWADFGTSTPFRCVVSVDNCLRKIEENVLYIWCMLMSTHLAISLLLIPVDCLVSRIRLEPNLLKNTNCQVCNSALASCVHLCSQRGGATKCLFHLASKNFTCFCFGFHSRCISYSGRSPWGRKRSSGCAVPRSKESHWNWERKWRVEHLSYERKYYSLPRHDVIFSHDKRNS